VGLGVPLFLRILPSLRSLRMTVGLLTRANTMGLGHLSHQPARRGLELSF